VSDILSEGGPGNTCRKLILSYLQSKKAGRPFADLSLGPAPAAVALDDALDDGQGLKKSA
jgi:hypothetical protein